MRRVSYLVLLLLMFTGTFFISVSMRPPDGSADSNGSTALDLTSGLFSGRHLLLVYVGSASCAWCNHPSLPGYLDIVRDSLETRATARGWAFVSIGVAANWGVDAGIDHLRKMRPFNEVAAGMSWLNSLALRYLFRDIPGEAATPELLVLTRGVRQSETLQVQATIDIGQEILLARKIGLPEIEHWVAPRGRSEGAGLQGATEAKKVGVECLGCWPDGLVARLRTSLGTGR